MFKTNEDGSIYLTRGDAVCFSVGATDGDGKAYRFKVGDEVRIKVFEKKNCQKVQLSKKFTVAAESDRVDIFLSSEDTKIGEVISKPKDLWYEIELNPDTEPQTIIGYDEDGAKIFRIYPEGNDI